MVRKPKKAVYWAIKMSDGTISTTRNAYNHWFGNDALCVFESKEMAKKYYCPNFDKLVRVQITELTPTARKPR